MLTRFEVQLHWILINIGSIGDGMHLNAVLCAALRSLVACAIRPGFDRQAPGAKRTLAIPAGVLGAAVLRGRLRDSLCAGCRRRWALFGVDKNIRRTSLRPLGWALLGNWILRRLFGVITPDTWWDSLRSVQ